MNEQPALIPDAETTVIPARFITFAEQVAELAREHGFHRMSITVHPGWKDTWHNEVQIGWEQGRHGDSNHRTHISSTVTVRHETERKPEARHG